MLSTWPAGVKLFSAEVPRPRFSLSTTSGLSTPYANETVSSSSLSPPERSLTARTLLSSPFSFTPRLSFPTPRLNLLQLYNGPPVPIPPRSSPRRPRCPRSADPLRQHSVRSALSSGVGGSRLTSFLSQSWCPRHHPCTRCPCGPDACWPAPARHVRSGAFGGGKRWEVAGADLGFFVRVCRWLPPLLESRWDLRWHME